MRVLVADDDALTRFLIRSKLEDRGDVVREAEDGQQAWEILLKETFELALIDLSMPNIDGYALIQFIRGYPRTRHLPVVVITSNTDKAAVRRAFDVGATGFLTKPINWTLFAQEIDYLVRGEDIVATERASKRRAEAVVRAKDALVAGLVARIREHTRYLIKCSEAALLPPQMNEQNETTCAAAVAAEARSMEAVLDEVLPFMRIVSEQIVVDDRLVAVERLVASCADRLAPMAVEANVVLEAGFIPPSLRIRCDEAAMERALGNVVRNAIEFAPPGSSVRIEVEVRDDGVLSINVDDEGPGVDPEVLAHCLTPFELREGHDLHLPEQPALGLAVANAIVSAHGGCVEVNARQPKGTRATLIIPAEIVEAELDEVA